MPFRIQVWIPVEIEDPQEYPTYEEAQEDIRNMQAMSPENIYSVEEA